MIPSRTSSRLVISGVTVEKSGCQNVTISVHNRLALQLLGGLELCYIPRHTIIFSTATVTKEVTSQLVAPTIAASFFLAPCEPDLKEALIQARLLTTHAAKASEYELPIAQNLKPGVHHRCTLIVLLEGADS